jgi:truncated hemoglobin YjbI
MLRKEKTKKKKTGLPAWLEGWECGKEMKQSDADTDTDRYERDEQLWTLGNRAAWLQLLREACNQLGYSEGDEGQRNSWILEREEAVAALRSVCDSHGDNDWDDRLHLMDVINKHLARHL